MKRPSVLFVCLGNICRSPLAEFAFRAAAERAGLDADIESAGTGTYHLGYAPDPRAQAVARKAGLDMTAKRARRVTPDDFRRFTHIVAMDRENLADLEAMRPKGATAELSMLLDHVPGRRGEPIADPYYGDAGGFATTWNDVTAGAEALVALLQKDRGMQSR